MLSLQRARRGAHRPRHSGTFPVTCQPTRPAMSTLDPFASWASCFTSGVQRSLRPCGSCSGAGAWIPLLAAGAADIARCASLRPWRAKCPQASLERASSPATRFEALANTCAQLGAAWHSFLRARRQGSLGSPSVEGGVVGAACSPSADTAAASACVTPPGGSPEGALLAALAAPKAGLAGVAIRAALWLFSSPPASSLAGGRAAAQACAVGLLPPRSPLFSGN